jgi:Putative zinc-finger
MSECKSIRDLLVLHFEGELGDEEDRSVTAHLSTCAACRAEAEDIRTVRGWLSDPELFAPRNDYGWQMLPEALAVRARAERKFWLPLSYGSAGWALSIAATLVIGFGLIYWAGSMADRPVAPAAVMAPVAASGNAAFLGRMYAAHARAATSEYLAACQDLVVDTLRAERNCDERKYDVSTEVTRARDLLHRKRLLDPELGAPEVARAKELCDELEGFLLNLSLSENCESRDKLLRMEHYVRKQQLLLRIRVLQGEL